MEYETECDSNTPQNWIQLRLQHSEDGARVDAEDQEPDKRTKDDVALKSTVDGLLKFRWQGIDQVLVGFLVNCIQRRCLAFHINLGVAGSIVRIHLRVCAAFDVFFVCCIKLMQLNCFLIIFMNNINKISGCSRINFITEYLRLR